MILRTVAFHVRKCIEFAHGKAGNKPIQELVSYGNKRDLSPIIPEFAASHDISLVYMIK